MCVITWPPNVKSIGLTVTVGEFKSMSGMVSNIGYPEGGPVQRITDWDGMHGRNWYWPVAWMRPLSDPDKEPTIIEEPIHESA
jgi:hypothetical protein